MTGDMGDHDERAASPEPRPAPGFAPMDGAGPTDEGTDGVTTAQFAPVGGVISGGAAARLLGPDGRPVDGDAPPPADGPATPDPVAAGDPPTPPPPGDGPRAGDGAVDGHGAAVPEPAVEDAPTVPVAGVVDVPTDPDVFSGATIPLPVAPRPAAAVPDLPPPYAAPDPGPGAPHPEPAAAPGPWMPAPTAGPGVVGADGLGLGRGSGIRPPGAPTFEPPPAPPPGLVPPAAPPPAGASPPPARRGATPWVLTGLLVLALGAVALLAVAAAGIADDRDEAEDRADEAEDRADEADGRADDLADQVDDLEEQVDELEDAPPTLPPDLEELERQIDQQLAAVEAREADLDEREQALDDREDELDEREDALDEGTGDVEVTAAADLETGDCFLEPAVGPGVPEQVTVVDCDDAHQGEVYVVEDLVDSLGAAYPGETVVGAAGIDTCEGELVTTFGGTPAEVGLLPVPRLPTEAVWAAGDTVLVCAAFPEDGVPVTGSQAD